MRARRRTETEQATHNDPTTSHIQSELLASDSIELVKLNAGDLGAKVRRKLVHVGISQECKRVRMLQRLVSGIEVLEGRERRQVQVLVEEGEEVLVRVDIARLCRLAPPPEFLRTPSTGRILR